MLKLLSIPVILFALVFGYFLSQNSWDVTLTTSVMKYELNKLIGDEKEKPEATPAENIDTEAEQTTSSSSHTKDSIYAGSGQSGETKFSDVKREGVHDSYQKKQ